MTLPPAAYTEADQFQRERRTLFARAWLPFCGTAQVAEPGAFVSHSLGGWSVFVLRGEDGVLRAFRNACRHQGMPVIEKPEGSCDQLRCRYHGWTYDRRGWLVAAPPLVAPEDPGADRHRLEEFELREAGGIAYVRITRGGAAEPPAIALDGARYAEAVTTDAACNWRAAAELLLANGAWGFAWPTAFHLPAEGGRVLRLVVPRSFARTRFVDLVFTAADGAATPLVAAARETAASDKAAAEALQARLAAGETETASDAVASFRRELAAACDEAS